MRAILDPNSPSLVLAFVDESALTGFLASARAEGGFQTELDRGLSQYDVVAVTVELNSNSQEAFKAYVARAEEVRAGVFLTALIVQDWSADESELLERLRRRTASDSRESEPTMGSAGEVRGLSAAHVLKDLNPSQRAVRAQRADRPERQVLLRDSSPQVLQGLLVNPRLEAKDVLRIAKSTHATAAILQRIAGDARWGKNQEILAAIVRNPHAPTLVATRLVDKLRTSDLRQMAKMSSGLKEAVRKAALLEYTKRSSR